VANNLNFPVGLEGFQSEWDEYCNTRIREVVMNAVGEDPDEIEPYLHQPFHNRTDSLTVEAIVPKEYSGNERNSMFERPSVVERTSLFSTISVEEASLEKLNVVDSPTSNTKQCSFPEMCPTIASPYKDAAFQRFSNFHTIGCCTNIDPDDVIAARLSRVGDNSAFSRFLSYYTIGLCATVEDEQFSISNASHKSEEALNSYSQKFMDGETLTCFIKFNYNDLLQLFGNIYDNITSWFQRFSEFQVISCDIEPELDYSAHSARAEALAKIHQSLHFKRSFARFTEFHTIGCCTNLEPDELAADVSRSAARDSGFERFSRYEVISLCVPLNSESQNTYKIHSDLSPSRYDYIEVPAIDSDEVPNLSQQLL